MQICLIVEGFSESEGICVIMQKVVSFYFSTGALRIYALDVVKAKIKEVCIFT